MNLTIHIDEFELMGDEDCNIEIIRCQNCKGSGIKKN